MNQAYPQSQVSALHHYPILAILLTALIFTGCAMPNAAAANRVAATLGDSIPTTYANPGVLVDTEWVLANLNNPRVKFIDVSGSIDEYNQGHIPGALYVNVSTELTDANDAVRGQILTQDALSALMSRLGITHDHTLVFYDNSDNLFAARAYWVLKYYQHDDVRIYNGGGKQWRAAGQTLATDSPAVQPSSYNARAADPAIRTTADYVLAHLGDDNVLLCDARSAGEFTGSDLHSRRGGHVPGARNVEWTNAVNSDGTFKDAATLYELYSRAGFSPDKQIITYCQTGVRGAHSWFVLRELLGFPDVRVFDGSWEEYGNRDDLPIEQ